MRPPRTRFKRNRVRQVRAEADQAIAEAHGAAEAARQRAQGRGDARAHPRARDAKANEIIRYSTTRHGPAVRALERWEESSVDEWRGSLPMLTSTSPS